MEANGRILPEVTDRPGRGWWSFLRERGGHVHLDTRVISTENGHVVLSNGEEFDANLIVWTAGNAATPRDLRSTPTCRPTTAGRVIVRADLRVGTDEEPGGGRVGRR